MSYGKRFGGGGIDRGGVVVRRVPPPERKTPDDRYRVSWYVDGGWKNKRYHAPELAFEHASSTANHLGIEVRVTAPNATVTILYPALSR